MSELLWFSQKFFMITFLAGYLKVSHDIYIYIINYIYITIIIVIKYYYF